MMSNYTIHLSESLLDNIYHEEPIRASRKIKKVTRKEVKDLAKQFPCIAKKERK
jgi:hypothetical protein